MSQRMVGGQFQHAPENSLALSLARLPQGQAELVARFEKSGTDRRCLAQLDDGLVKLALSAVVGGLFYEQHGATETGLLSVKLAGFLYLLLGFFLLPCFL